MNELRVNVYRLVNECVERGIELGWNLAHKHGKPDKDLIFMQIENAVMLELSEHFLFDELEKE